MASTNEKTYQYGNFGAWKISEIKKMQDSPAFAEQMRQQRIAQQKAENERMLKQGIEQQNADLIKKAEKQAMVTNHLETMGPQKFYSMISPLKTDKIINSSTEITSSIKTNSANISSSIPKATTSVSSTSNTTAPEFKKYTSDNMSKNTSLANPAHSKYSSNSSLTTGNLYSNNGLKAAQYEYDLKMHTPSKLSAKIGSNINVASVVGAQFGHMATNLAKTGLQVAKVGASTTMGMVANDPGSRSTVNVMKYTGKTSFAVAGDINAINKRAINAMSTAAGIKAGASRTALSQLNNNALMAHFGKTDLSKLTSAQVREGCLSLLKSKNIDITSAMLNGNSAKVAGRLNKLLKGTTDANALLALNFLRNDTLKNGMKVDLRIPHFRLLAVGTMLAGSMKNKFLSNDSMEGLSFILQTKDKAVSLAKSTVRFFYNTAQAAQRGAKLATKGMLMLKRTKLYQKLHSKHTQVLINRYYKKYGTRKAKKLADKIAIRTGKKAGRVTLKARMEALARKLLKKAFGKAFAKFAATKIGGFIVKKIGESAIVSASADFLAKWIPVVGQIYFVIEIVVVCILVVIVLITALQLKNAIDDIGNAGAYPEESLVQYAGTLKQCSDEYKRYYSGVMNRDEKEYLKDGKHVPLLISHLTKDKVDVTFNDYMAVDTYKTTKVDSESLRTQYGNQPEILMMAHVMSEMNLDIEDKDFVAAYNDQIMALYNVSHIMYIDYFQDPIGQKTVNPDYVSLNKLNWNPDTQTYDEETINYVPPDNPWEIPPDAPAPGTPMPIVLGTFKKNPTALECTWNANMTFDVYYFDQLFGLMDSADQSALYRQAQVYVKYTQGINSVHSSLGLPMKDENVNICMVKVNKGISEKMDELGLHGDIMAITCGIVANLCSEGGCKGNNYENSFNEKHMVSDEQVTDIYNSYFYTEGGELKDNFDDVWNSYLNGEGHNGIKLSGGYGIVQWTTEGRKRGLFRKAYEWAIENDEDVDISNIDMQIAYMIDEMEERNYFNSGGIFASNAVAEAIGYYLCQYYETPLTVVQGDMSACEARGRYAKALYNSFDGVIGDVDYDDEEMNNYVQFLEKTGQESNNGLEEISKDRQILEGYDINKSVDTEQDGNIFIQDYLRIQGCRPAPDYCTIANIYAGNYGPQKDESALASGDMIVWENFIAVYIGNGKVLCPESLKGVKNTTNADGIGKFPLTSVKKIMGNDYKIISPIKDVTDPAEPGEDETEETE